MKAWKAQMSGSGDDSGQRCVVMVLVGSAVASCGGEVGCDGNGRRRLRDHQRLLLMRG